MIFRAAGIVFCILSIAAAHMVPIYPNHLFMHVENNRLIVVAQASAPFWIQDVFGGKPSASNWPEDLRFRTRRYWDRHVVLTVDGQPLISELKDARFVEEFWDQNEHSYLLLTFHYPLPPNSRLLSGTITLYEEDRHPSASADWKWLSVVHVQGQKPAEIAVPIEQPGFSVPIADLIPSPAQRLRRGFMRGLLFWQSIPAFLLLSAGILLLVASRKSVRAAAWSILPTAIALGIGFAASIPFHIVTVIGAGLTLTGWSACVVAALLVYERRLRHHSESRAAVLFRSQTHFLGLLAAGTGIYLLMKGLQP